MMQYYAANAATKTITGRPQRLSGGATATPTKPHGPMSYSPSSSSNSPSSSAVAVNIKKKHNPTTMIKTYKLCTTPSTSSAAKKKYDPCKSRPYNCYQIYYIVERELFLQSHSNYKAVHASAAAGGLPITGYENLTVPDLPIRYACLDLASDWYMPGEYQIAFAIYLARRYCFEACI